MLVKVEIVGHQFYRSVTGEVLLWSTGIIRHDKMGVLSVPCVVIKTANGVETIPLQEQFRDIKVTTIEKLTPPLSGSTAA